jgi:hypothetical protein
MDIIEIDCDGYGILACNGHVDKDQFGRELVTLGYLSMAPPVGSIAWVSMYCVPGQWADRAYYPAAYLSRGAGRYTIYTEDPRDLSGWIAGGVR